MHLKNFALLMSASLASAFAGVAHSGTRSETSAQGDCAGLLPSFGLTRQTLVRPGPFVANYVFGDAFEGPQPLLQWADLFGSDFPSRESGNATLRIAAGMFVALAFNTGSRANPIYGGIDTGLLNLALPASAPGVPAISISACPGDFSNPPVASADCYLSPGSASVNWQVIGGVAALSSCPLAENTTYYLNLAFVDRETGTSTCSFSQCDSFLEAR